MNKKLIIASVVTALMLPVAAFALQTIPQPTVNPALTLGGLIDTIFNFIWPIIAVIIVIFLILAAFNFITANGDADKVADGKNALIWASVGIVVLLISFSIPFVKKNELGL